MNNQQLGKDETGEKKGGGYGRGEGAKVNLQALRLLLHYQTILDTRQFPPPPPPRDICLPELWSENNISITIEICMSIDFAPSEKIPGRKPASECLLLFLF